MDCMCAIQRVNGHNKRFTVSAFERGMVIGARSAGLSVSRTATLLGFSRSTVTNAIQTLKRVDRSGIVCLYTTF